MRTPLAPGFSATVKWCRWAVTGHVESRGGLRLVVMSLTGHVPDDGRSPATAAARGQSPRSTLHGEDG
jgi:hypothetical protein